MRYFSLVLFMLFSFLGTAQTGTYTDPYFFESGPSTYYNITGGQSNLYPVGSDSACMATTDNAVFVYLRFCTAGNMDIQLSTSGGTAIDLSYVVFGPLSNPLDTSQYLNSNVVDCMSSIYTSATINLPNSAWDDYYMMVFTNSDPYAGSFILGQISGTGESDSSCVSIQNCSHPAFTQPVCEVTTDTSNQYWTVVFERDTTYGQLTYEIQRESTVQGQYFTVGTVAPGDSSVYTDNSVFAQQQAQRYRIKAIDSCGNQRLSTYHQPIHLVTSTGVNNLNQLIWSPYTGFSYGTYFIYRGTSMNNMVLVDSISASFTSYTDMNSPPGLSYYQVAVVPPNPCVASRSLSFVKSNVATKQYLTVGMDEDIFAALQVYPNPSNGLLQVKFDQKVQLEILDISGRLLRTETLSGGTSQLALEDLQDGMYVLRFTQDGNTCTKTLMLQH